MKKMHVVSLALAAAFFGTVGPDAVRAEGQIAEERVVPESQLAREVSVRDVEAHDGTISGTVVNNSGKVLKDVRLMIQHMWLWENEFHPGTDDPSRVDYYTLPGEIGPGQQARFTYRRESPLPQGRGGHFETQVRVASVVAYPPTTAGTPGEPMRAPTAGSGMQAPAGGSEPRNIEPRGTEPRGSEPRGGDYR